MKKGKLIPAIVVLSASIAGVSGIASANIGGGSGAMASAVNQANDARDYVASLMTNITTQYNATGAITAAYPRIPANSGSIQRVYSGSNGVITVQYKSRGISGPLQSVVLTFTPQHGGRQLNVGRRDANIDDWTCTYKAGSSVRNSQQYGVLHNIFVYAKYPLNICVRSR